MAKTIYVLLVYLLPRLDSYSNMISFWDWKFEMETEFYEV